LAVVEASPNKTRVRRPEDGDSFMVCTNHFVHAEMQDMEDIDERARCNWDSLLRYATIYEAIKRQNGEIDVGTAQKILSNHSGYVCSHQNKIKLGTIWSVAARLKEPRIFRAEGHPCRTKYKQDLRLNKAIRRRQKVA